MFYNKKIYMVIFLLIFLIGFIEFGIGENNESVLFEDDFEDGNAEGWILGPGWEVVSDDSYVLKGQGHDLAQPIVRGWSDHSIEFRFKLLTEKFHFHFRVSEQRLSPTENIISKYFLEIQENLLYLKKQYGSNTDSLDMTAVSLATNFWHTLKVEMEGTSIEIYLNDILAMDLTDQEGLILFGSFYFETFENTQVYIDDISVTGDFGEIVEQDLTWIRTGGPSGGLGYDVRIHPLDKNIMFVTDNPSGVNKSYDGGDTWVQRNEGMTVVTGASGGIYPIFSLTIDLNNPNIIWSGMQEARGVFKSTDKGESWSLKVNGIKETYDIAFRNFAIDPRNSDIVYAGTEILTGILGKNLEKVKGKIYKTEDRGENWTSIWEGNSLVRFILFDWEHPDTMYASTGIFDREAWNDSSHGVLKSTDGGVTWNPSNNGLENLYVGFLDMHPTDTQILCAGVGTNSYPEGGGVYKTTDGGKNWIKLLSDDVVPITAVVFSPSDPEVIYAGSVNAFYRSDDGGETWTTYAKEGGGYGPVGIRAGTPISMVVDPDNSMIVFVNNYNGGNYKSTDGGETWEEASDGYTGAALTVVDMDRDHPATVYTIGRNGPFRSTNGGNDWTGIAYYPANEIQWCGLALNPQNPQEVLIGYGIIFKSTDGGNTWKEVYNAYTDEGQEGQFQSIVYAPSDSTIIYAGSHMGFGVLSGSIPAQPSVGILKSTDSGESWEVINNGLETSMLNILCIAVHPTDPDIVYAGTLKDGLYKTTDGGQNWVAKNTGLTSMAIYAAAIDPVNPDIVYVGLGEGGGVFKSTDGGTNWKETNNGVELHCPQYLLPVGKVELGGSYVDPARLRNPIGHNYAATPWTNIRSIVIDPTNSSNIFASDFYTGVYFSSNAGETWKTMNEGLTTINVEDMAISNDGHVLYGATGGGGIFRLVLGENQIPQISSISPSDTGLVEIVKGDSLDFKVNGYDLDGDTLLYSWLLDEVLIKESINSKYTLKTDMLNLGQHNLLVDVSDGDTTISASWEVKILSPTEVLQEDFASLPQSFTLMQNYPNPFNPETMIKFGVKESCHVILKVYDILGREVSVLTDKKYKRGYHRVRFQADDLPSGLYLYAIEMGDFKAVLKMLLLE